MLVALCRDIVKTLKGLTPHEFISQTWTKEPKKFRVDPTHQMPGLNILDLDNSQPNLYRRDVDGLRALSIILILAAHLKLRYADAGFIGVDIFFVISGYVIHRTIISDLESGTFSFNTFYWRRVRRIVPSLALVLIGTLCVGVVTLPPTQFAHAATSALAALFFASNIHFNETLGYFAPAAHSIPLLHTWSLGVEEQFYIIVPVVLWLSATKAKSNRIAYAVIGVTLFSFVWCVVETSLNPRGAFYLPMSRLWELGLGGCVALFERRFGDVNRFALGLAISGALLIFCSMIVISDGSQFPGVVAALPVAGATLLIVSGGRNPVSAILSTGPAVFIGKHSYTLYLVHWPVIVFWEMARGEIAPIETPLILALIFALATIISRFVEQPLRRSASPRDSWGKIIALTFGIALSASAIVRIFDGFPQRLPAQALDVVEKLAAAQANRPFCAPLSKSKGGPCQFGHTGPAGIAIVGDSHAAALGPELAESILNRTGTSGVLSFSNKGCAVLHNTIFEGFNAENCLQRNEATWAQIEKLHPRVVILIGRWASLESDILGPGDGKPSQKLYSASNGHRQISLAEALIQTVERMKQNGIRVLIVGPIPEINFNVPQELVRSRWYGIPMPTSKLKDFLTRQRRVLAALEKTRQVTGVDVVYPHNILCNKEECITTIGNMALYKDDDHMSAFGSKFVAPQIVSAVSAIVGRDQGN